MKSGVAVIRNYGTNVTTNVEAQYATSDNLDARIALHNHFSTNKYGWSKWVFDHMKFEGKERVLELGCGNGGLWRSNLYRVPVNMQITLSDYSEGMLESARKNLNSASAAIEYEIIDAENIPYETSSFDVVIANHMLYHVPDRRKALSEIKRVLKDGGILYATTIGADHLIELMDVVKAFDTTIEYPASSVAYDFGLENGASQLSEFFNNVDVLRYEDSLEVTDADILVNYVLSSQGFGNTAEIISGDKKESFKNYLSAMIEKDGCIRITKASGMFIARKFFSRCGMNAANVRIEYCPEISDDMLWAFYVRNDICETGFGKEIAVKPLKSTDVFVGAFYEELLVGLVRAAFDGVSAHINEFCLELELQGGELEYENGSLIEKDTFKIAQKMGLLLVDELRKRGNTSINATILENCEEAVYASIGFRHNKHHLDYTIDERPYIK